MSVTRWDSISNTVPFRTLSEADVIALVNKALSANSHHTTTYKYAFFKSIIDNVFNVDVNTYLLSYDNLAARFKKMHLIIRKNNVFFLLKTFEQIYNRKSSKR